MSFRLIDLPVHTDARGSLTPIEFDASLPFTPQRVYYAYGTKSARGGHCHLVEQEIFVCLSGKCRALVDADGTGKQEIWLDAPTKALYTSTHVWHEFDSFSDGATLLCLSSTHYLPGAENYVTDYDAFKKLIVAEAVALSLSLSKTQLLENWHQLKQVVVGHVTPRFVYPREVWFAHLGENVGREQNGKGTGFVRPVLVLHAYGPDLVLVVPLSTQIKKEQPFICTFSFHGRLQSALLSQLRVLDRRRLLNRFGKLSHNNFSLVQEKLKPLIAS